MQPIRRHWLSSILPFAILASCVGIAVLITMAGMRTPSGPPLYVRGVQDPIAYGTFRTAGLLVDDLATIGSNASALENPNRVMSVGGPWQNVFHVGSDMSEIFLQTLQDGTSPHPATSDVCGVVVRNQVTFDTTTGSNQACAVYGEVTSTVATGANPLVNYAVRGNAICGSGVTNCYAFFGDHGTVRADDGAQFGPEQVTGAFTQQDGNVSLNFGGSAGGGSGTTTIKGDTHVVSHSLVVDTTGEFGGNLTADSALRVNGNANLAGSPSSIVFLNSINSSGLPIPVTNTLAFPVEHDTGPGAADPKIQLSVVTGTGTALTLADGTKDGQIKSFSIFSGTGSVTPAHGTVYSWTTTPASVQLQWDASNTRWTSTAMNNVTGSAPSGTGTANQSTKWSGSSTLTNGWAGDNGTTWGSAGVFTINESSGSASANGDIQTQGALKLATATWTQGASAPVGACTTGSMYSVTSNTSPAFYVCASSAWLAVAGGTVTGTGTTGNLAAWASATSLGNYAGSACGSGTFANAIGSSGGLSCGSASGGTGTVTSVACGTGLTCSPSPITTSGTISVTAVTPSMTIANATQSSSVNLSTVGTGQIDWLFQGAPTSTRVYDNFTGSIFEKLTGAGVLIQPGVDLLGSTGAATQTNGTVTFTSNAADTIDNVALSSVQGAGVTGVTGTGGGIRLVAPVTTTQRVFRFYTSHSFSTWVCTAHLLDGSFADQTTTSTTASTIEEVGTVTVTAGSNTYLVVNCAVTATTAGTVVLKWYADVLSTG